MEYKAAETNTGITPHPIQDAQCVGLPLAGLCSVLAGQAQCWAPCWAPQDRRRGCPATSPAKGHKGLEYLTQEEMLRELGLSCPGAEKAQGDLSRVCV